MELMYVNKLFNDCYKLYKRHAGDLKAEDFTQIALECAEIADKNSNAGFDFAADMVATVYAELGRLYHGKQ